MARRRPGRNLWSMEFRLASAAPAFAFGEDMTIVAWNEGAEELTGVPAGEAIGRPCWSVLAGCDDAGGLVCHRHCSRARLAREGFPLKTLTMNVRCDGGRRRIAVDTLSLVGGESSLFVHVLRDGAETEPAPELGPPPHLTPRQRDILGQLAEGAPAKTIAAKLGLREATVRNHIRAVLVELGAHSQLEAVFRARCYGLL